MKTKTISRFKFCFDITLLNIIIYYAFIYLGFVFVGVWGFVTPSEKARLTL